MPKIDDEDDTNVLSKNSIRINSSIPESKLNIEQNYIEYHVVCWS